MNTGVNFIKNTSHAAIYIQVQSWYWGLILWRTYATTTIQIQTELLSQWPLNEHAKVNSNSLHETTAVHIFFSNEQLIILALHQIKSNTGCLTFKAPELSSDVYHSDKAGFKVQDTIILR